MIKQEELIKVLLSPSTTSWDELQDKVSQILNIHPASLQLQYCFSNEKNNSLFFNLDSHDDYIGMCGQLRPFVVLRIFSNGKPSKSGGLYTPPMFCRKLPESWNVLVGQGPNRHIYSRRSLAESTGNQHIPVESAESVQTFSAEEVHWTLAESSGITRLQQNNQTLVESSRIQWTPVDSSRAYL